MGSGREAQDRDGYSGNYDGTRDECGTHTLGLLTNPTGEYLTGDTVLEMQAVRATRV